MAFFIFRLDGFQIDNTRAVDEDTDVVSIAVKLNGQTMGTEIRHLGDVDNGFHPVNLELGAIFVNDPADQVEFNFQIVNAGNKNDQQVKDLLTKGADALSAKLFATGTFWAIAAAGAIKLLSALFTVDCDGPVAVDAVGFTGEELESLTLQNNTHTVTKFFPGTDSDTGCGSNSRYTVTWSVRRIPRLEGVISIDRVPLVKPAGRALIA